MRKVYCPPDLAIFPKLYMEAFGQNKRFPKTPQSKKISTELTAALGGWLIVRVLAVDLFGGWKDQWYVMLFHLLDEICCLNFFMYSVIFRGGEFDRWLHVLLRVAMLFIIFNRRKYNKATLCQMSDLLFHLSDNAELANEFQSHLEVFTEKKIEILHSIFRR